MTVRIGLTGPIGCGKSTVAGWLGERRDVTVIDADAIARDVLEPGTPELDAVYARFGDELRGADGRLDRAALGRLVFPDAAALHDLESIVHPAVRRRIMAVLEDADSAGSSAVIVEAIKLLEGGLADLCDEVWLVVCDAAAQRDRLADRGLPPADAAARIDAQAELVARARPRATRTIDTSGSPTDVREAARAALDAAISAGARQSQSLRTYDPR